MAESGLFERGLQRRREVLGSEYVDANLRDSDEFTVAFQRAVTEVARGWAWSRPGPDAKTRYTQNPSNVTPPGPTDAGLLSLTKRSTNIHKHVTSDHN
jgi:4-carboxymuconolactone decarboxylase